MIPGRWALGAALVVSLQGVAPGVAHADAIAEASKAFSAGLAADKRQDFVAAVQFYRRAYEIKAHPNAAYNIAVDLEKLGRTREAAEWYETYANTVVDPREKATTKQHLEELENLDATITVASTPVGATVKIDNTRVGTTPYSGTLETGHHVIAIGTEQREVSVLYGEPVDITVELTPEQFGAPAAPTDLTPPSLVDPQTLAPPPGEAGGGIRILGGPKGAYVFIDNQAVGVIGTWSGSIEVAVGSHDISIQRHGFEPFRRNVYVTAHEETNVDVPGGLQSNAQATEDAARPVRFLFGIAGGAGIDKDTATEPMVYAEGGIRGAKTDIITRVGAYGGRIAGDVALRYYLSTGPFRPMVGGGFTYLPSVNYEFLFGFRFDVKRSGPTRMSVLAESGVRMVKDSDTDPPKPVFPVLLFVELAR